MDDVAGILLGLILSGLLITTLQGGPGGATAWFKAKFLGQATGTV